VLGWFVRKWRSAAAVVARITLTQETVVWDHFESLGAPALPQGLRFEFGCDEYMARLEQISELAAIEWVENGRVQLLSRRAQICRYGVRCQGRVSLETPRDSSSSMILRAFVALGDRPPLVVGQMENHESAAQARGRDFIEAAGGDTPSPRAKRPAIDPSIRSSVSLTTIRYSASPRNRGRRTPESRSRTPRFRGTSPLSWPEFVAPTEGTAPRSADRIADRSIASVPTPVGPLGPDEIDPNDPDPLGTGTPTEESPRPQTAMDSDYSMDDCGRGSALVVIVSVLR